MIAACLLYHGEHCTDVPGSLKVAFSASSLTCARKAKLCGVQNKQSLPIQAPSVLADKLPCQYPSRSLLLRCARHVDPFLDSSYGSRSACEKGLEGIRFPSVDASTSAFRQPWLFLLYKIPLGTIYPPNAIFSRMSFSLHITSRLRFLCRHHCARFPRPES